MLKTIASAVLVSGSVVLADDVPSWSSSVTPYARYSFDQDLNDDNSFSVLRSGATFRTGGPVTESVFSGLNLDAEYSNYDFGDDAFPDDFVFIDLRPSVSVYVNEDFGVYGGALLGFGGEPDADVADSLVYGGFVGFNYQIAKGVWIGTGVGVSTQLEDDLLVVPLISLEWAITDRLTLNASGLKGDLTYKVDDEWSVYVEGRYDIRQYRLHEDSIVSEGVLGDEAVLVGVGVAYSPSDNITLSLGGGAIVWREITLYDDDENKLSQDTADPTAYAAASVKIAW
jgi:long-subunit fatty acid transport protein